MRFTLFSAILFLTSLSPALAQNHDSPDEADSSALSAAAYGMAWDGGEDPGYGAGGKVAAELTEVVGIEARGGWVKDIHAGLDGANVDVVPLDLGFALHMPAHLLSRRESSLRPFIIGGASYVLIDAKNGNKADDEAGWYAGGGFEIGPRKGIGFLFEALFRGVKVDIRHADGSNADGKIDTAAANAGIYYRW